MIRIQLILQAGTSGTNRGCDGEEVWVEFVLVETLFPKGPIGQVAPQVRRAYLQDRVYSSDVSLSTFDGTTTVLALADVRASDWLAGTIATAYDVRSSSDPADLDRLTRNVAIKEHVARKLALHPAKLLVLASGVKDGTRDGEVAVIPASSPYERPHYVSARRADDGWHVVDGHADSEEERLDLSPVWEFWRARANPDGSLVEDITLALMQRFVRRVEIADPEAFSALQGKGVLYLANHQMDLESALFVSLTAGLQGLFTTAIARLELGESWIGPFFDICFQHPKIDDPNILLLIDRDSPEAVLASLESALDRVQANDTSLLVHVEGKHALRAGEPVEVVSASLIDLAVARGIPIVPVRFAGGLPVAPLAEPAKFPVDYGQQDVLIGAPLLADELAALPSAVRKSAVLDALNGFDGRWRHEQPIAGDADFAAAVADWQAARGVNDVQATLYRTLAAAPNPSEETLRLLAAVEGERSIEGDDEVARWLRMCAAELFGI